MTGREQDEYNALRATIRERGTARVYVLVAGMTAWAAVTIATAALASTPLATLLPLLVLASVFEAIFALHVGVERLGRYIQVFYEEDRRAQPDPPAPPAPPAPLAPPAPPALPVPPALPARPGWEHAAMAFGRPAGAAAIDALFAVPFLLATLFNIAPALLLDPVRTEMIFVGGAHALFVLRLLVARHLARTQRAIDLQRFQQLKRQQQD
jgi:hypothetical protein